MMSQPTTSIICAACCVFIISTSLFHPPSRSGNGSGWGGVYNNKYVFSATTNHKKHTRNTKHVSLLNSLLRKVCCTSSVLQLLILCKTPTFQYILPLK